MKKNIISLMAITLSGIILFNACTKNKNTDNNSTIPTGYKINASQNVENQPYKIELWSKHDSMYVGYNNIFIAIKNTTTNLYVQNADITIRPFMPQMPNMGMMMPCNNPITENASNNMFVSGVDFTMKGYADLAGFGPWNLEVKAKLPNMMDSIKATCSFNVPDTRKKTNGVSTNSNETFANTLPLNGESYRVTLVAPREFITGVQPISIRIFKKIGTGPTAYWELVRNKDLKITNIKPWMPDPGMEHSSLGNIDPILNFTTGVYIGNLNLTMTGLWDIEYQLTDGTNNVDGKFTFIL